MILWNSNKKHTKHNITHLAIVSSNESSKKQTRVAIVDSEAGIVTTIADQRTNVDSEASDFSMIVSIDTSNVCKTSVDLTNVDQISTIQSETGVILTNVDHGISEDCEVGVFWTNMDHDNDIRKKWSERSHNNHRLKESC